MGVLGRVLLVRPHAQQVKLKKRQRMEKKRAKKGELLEK